MCLERDNTPYSKVESVSATGSATVSGNIDVPTGHGDVMAVEVIAANNTIATVDGVTFTLSNNGNDFMKNEPALKYSPLYSGFSQKRFIRIPSGGQLNYSFTNDQGTTVVFYIRMEFEKAEC